MPSAHARLSPSAASRWIECPASVLLAEKFPKSDDGGFFAREGTAAHALAETILNGGSLDDWAAGEGSEFTYSADEMKNEVEKYISFIEERVSVSEGATLFVEQRLPTGVPTCWGTSDAVLVFPAEKTIEIVDLKYGKGVEVLADNNPQTRLYGAGALDEFSLIYDLYTVRMTIVQPRLNSISTEELSADDLRAWRDSIIPIAKSALDGSGGFGPSEKACRWCPASGACRAQAEAFAREDFPDPEVLSPDEIAAELEKVSATQSWLTALKEHALGVAINGEGIPGWKAVESGGRRTIPDVDRAFAAILGSGLGLTPDDFAPRKLVGIGALEKLLPGKTFGEVLGDLIVKTEGSPSLVRESDKRPAISTADDFEVLE